MTNFKNKLHYRLLSTSNLTSFESLLICLNYSSPVLIILIYRPPATNNFIEEIAEFLGEILTKYDHIILPGDFNIHVCFAANALAKDFFKNPH